MLSKRIGRYSNRYGLPIVMLRRLGFILFTSLSVAALLSAHFPAIFFESGLVTDNNYQSIHNEEDRVVKRILYWTKYWDFKGILTIKITYLKREYYHLIPPSIRF